MVSSSTRCVPLKEMKSMKALFAVALTAALLTGCSQAGPAAAPVTGGMTAQKASKGTLLYGIWFRGTVTHVKQAGKGDDWAAFRVTMNAVSAHPGTHEPDGEISGKFIVIWHKRDGAPGPKVGETVEGFANYPTIDQVKKTFV